MVNRKPKVGDSVFWRSMRMEVTEVDADDRELTRYTNGHYRCVTKTSDLKWYPDYKVWGVDGCEGRLPKVVRGEIVDPELPTCQHCGELTFRRDSFCTNCRLEKR